jgi:hypothetical protein
VYLIVWWVLYNEDEEIIDINNRLIVPLVKKNEVLEENHDHMLAGHLGIAGA